MWTSIYRPPVVKKLCTIPVDLHQWIQQQGASTLASTNNVIVSTLRKAMLEQQNAADCRGRLERAEN